MKAVTLVAGNINTIPLQAALWSNLEEIRLTEQ